MGLANCSLHQPKAYYLIAYPNSTFLFSFQEEYYTAKAILSDSTTEILKWPSANQTSTYCWISLYTDCQQWWASCRYIGRKGVKDSSFHNYTCAW